jgi:hypothetical protein
MSKERLLRCSEAREEIPAVRGSVGEKPVKRPGSFWLPGRSAVQDVVFLLL